MIQRVQSIFLMLIGVCMISMLFLPIWSKTGIEGEVAKLTAMNLTYQKQTQLNSIPTFYIGILCVISMMVAYTSLFSFKNRMLQIKLNMANSLVIISAMGCCAYLIATKGEVMISGAKGNMGFGVFMPAVALIFNMIANRFIWKDEKLVRSSNRLR